MHSQSSLRPRSKMAQLPDDWLMEIETLQAVYMDQLKRMPLELVIDAVCTSSCPLSLVSPNVALTMPRSTIKFAFVQVLTLLLCLPVHLIEKEAPNIIEIILWPNPDAKDNSENQGTTICFLIHTSIIFRY